MTIHDLDDTIPVAARVRKYPIWCMTKAEFDALPEYSATNPTGVVNGKVWRRHDGACSPIRAERERAEWFICMYVPAGRDRQNRELSTVKFFKPVLSRDMVESDL